MLTFKGTKGKDTTNESLKQTKLEPERLDNFSPIKPILPPLYSEYEIERKSERKSVIKKGVNLETPSILYRHLQQKKLVDAPQPEMINLNLADNKRYSDTMKITSTIDLVFDKYTGNLKEITSILNDDIESGYLPQKFNIPIPEVINWLNKKHIIFYSRKTIGTLLIIDSKEVIDDYPDCVSCILFEKVSENDNFDIKVIVNLKYEDRYIKKSELLDVIYTNMNNFWIIIKKEDGLHLLNYYKTKQDVLNSKNSSIYSYTEFILEGYTFICSMWTIYDITPDVIYMIVHDQYKNVSIQQYTTIINDNDIPTIELYYVDSRLTDCGKFVGFCSNYNISMFSIILELENEEKHFYTAIMVLSQIDDHKRTQVRLDFSKTILCKNISNEDAHLMIYNIMVKTEESINIEEKKKNDSILKAKKKYLADKEVENAKNELERRAKEAKEMADKLLEEEEKETLKKKKLQLKKNVRLESKRKEKELLEEERLKQKKLDLEKQLIEEERLKKEVLEKERLEEERLALERLLEQERLEEERLDEERLEEEKLCLEKQRLEKEKVKEKSNHIKNKKLILKKSKKISIKVIETIIEEPTTVTVSEEPTTVTVSEEPTTVTVSEEPTTVTVSEEPTTVTVIEEPTTVTIIEEPTTVTVSEEPTTVTVSEENEIVEEPTDTLSTVTKPYYYISNKIEYTYSFQSVYFMFMYNMSMINPIVANSLLLSQTKNQYNELLIINRFYVMYALDMLVINSLYIKYIKNIIDKNKDTNYPISSIYGSYLPIIYSIILNEIGFDFNAFGNTINPLDKLKDYDTLVLKLLYDYNETHTDNEFIKEQSMLIGYNSDNKPITRTKIQSSSLQNLLCKCWDLNYTSAILLFEDNKEPYIYRNPDFTEFLFGKQPIQILSGKTESSLYDYNSTIYRLNKAIATWY
jgi:hypothetical protein